MAKCQFESSLLSYSRTNHSRDVASNLKNQFQHIDHQFKNVPQKGFFILNMFQSELKNPSLEQIVQSDLLSEEYFTTAKQKIENQKQLDKLMSMAKKANAYEVDENDTMELYGPILMDKIQLSDFKKMDYSSYLIKMQNYITEWTDEGWEYLIETFQEFYHYSLNELTKHSAEKRSYYFLDAELIEKNKLYEVNWYDYFLCIVSTLDDSDKVIIMNFGND